MFKFIRSLIIWKVIRNNMPLAKKCFIALAIFLVSLYFFSDWENYFEKKNNLNMLLYTKITKYLVLIYAVYSFTKNAKKLSLLKKKEKQISSEEGMKEIMDSSEEEFDPDLEVIRNKPKLTSHSDLMSKKNKKGS